MLTLADIENMEIGRIIRWAERLNEQREADADAIRNARSAPM